MNELNYYNIINFNCNSLIINNLQVCDKLSLDIAKNNFILISKFRKPMMKKLCRSFRVSSQGLGRELAPLNFPCGLILFYNYPTLGKFTYLLITLLNTCKKCFDSSEFPTSNLRNRNPTFCPVELWAQIIQIKVHNKKVQNVLKLYPACPPKLLAKAD